MFLLIIPVEINTSFLFNLSQIRHFCTVDKLIVDKFELVLILIDMAFKLKTFTREQIASMNISLI